MKLVLISLLVYNTSNTCCSSKCGGWHDFTRQEYFSQSTSRAVSAFNSINQNMCGVAGTYPGVFLERELCSKTYLRQTKSTRTFFARANSASNILAAVEEISP